MFTDNFSRNFIEVIDLFQLYIGQPSSAVYMDKQQQAKKYLDYSKSSDDLEKFSKKIDSIMSEEIDTPVRPRDMPPMKCNILSICRVIYKLFRLLVIVMFYAVPTLVLVADLVTHLLRAEGSYFS